MLNYYGFCDILNVNGIHTNEAVSDDMLSLFAEMR